MSRAWRRVVQNAVRYCVTQGAGFLSFDGSDSHILLFRKRKGDEVDGMDQVAKKKSKKDKDKDSKLEKALKVSSELCVSFCRCLGFLSSFWKKVQGGEQDF